MNYPEGIQHECSEPLQGIRLWTKLATQHSTRRVETKRDMNDHYGYSKPDFKPSRF